jgi:hypothetical protein
MFSTGRGETAEQLVSYRGPRRLKPRYAKPMKLVCLLIFFAFVSGHAHAISSEKCLALGGKYLAGECYKGAESELMWSDADVVTLSREQCETADGKMLNGDGVAEVSEDECRRLGGELDPRNGCVMEPTAEECRTAGGVVTNDGRCDLQ